jgi:hypothetical protein
MSKPHLRYGHTSLVNAALHVLQSTGNSASRPAYQLVAFEGELILEATDGQTVLLLVI